MLFSILFIPLVILGSINVALFSSIRLRQVDLVVPYSSDNIMRRVKVYSTQNMKYIHCDCKEASSKGLIQLGFPSHSSNGERLVIVTTTDSLKRKEQNTIISMSILSKQSNVDALVFSESPRVIEFCKQWNIKVLPILSKNIYGLPLFRDLMYAAQKMFPESLLAYINSDILLNPNAIRVALAMASSMQNRKYLFASRVLSAKVRPLKDQSLKSYEYYLQKLHGKMRHYRSSDLFIFPPHFNYSHLGFIVVGRWYIDNVILDVIHQLKYNLIDLTELTSIHQGFDTSGSKTDLDPDNFYWNKKYLKARRIDDTYLLFNYLVCTSSVY